MTLWTSQIESYHGEGFLVLRGILEEALLDRVAGGLLRVIRGGGFLGGADPYPAPQTDDELTPKCPNTQTKVECLVIHDLWCCYRSGSGMISGCGGGLASAKSHPMIGIMSSVLRP
jgi:hypothetical protein